MRDGQHGPGPGPGPGAHAEIQLHGHNGQRHFDIGISEAPWFSAKPRRMRLLSGHDQLVSSATRLACRVVYVKLDNIDCKVIVLPSSRLLAPFFLY